MASRDQRRRRTYQHSGFGRAKIRTWDLPNKIREYAAHDGDVRRVSAPLIMYVSGSDAIRGGRELQFQESGQDFLETWAPFQEPPSPRYCLTARRT